MPGADPPNGYVPLDVGEGFTRTLGRLFIDRSRQRLGIWVECDQCNPVGTCHGGALATFADSQILAIDPPSQLRTEHHPTVNLSVDYMAPAHAGDWLEAEVTLDAKTRSLLFTRAAMYVGRRLIARASATYRYLPARR